MNTTLDKKYELKIDKFATIIDKDNYIMPKNISKQGFGIGVNYKETPKGLKLEFSSKLFSTPTSLNALKWANNEEFSDKIYDQTQIIINNDFLINYAPIFRVDAFEDIFVDDIPSYYLSELKEILKGKSDKYDVNKYSDLSYIHGLTVIPKANKKWRVSIYTKGRELMKSRNKKYREIFNSEFLEETEHIIRFEYQIRNFEDMRIEFGIPKTRYLSGQLKKPTIKDIFINCKRNVVADLFDKLIA